MITKTTPALLTVVLVAILAGTMISIPQMIGSVKAQQNACPPGYTFHPTQGQCIDSAPTCPTGTQFNAATNKCESTPTCPDGSAFNAATNKCEAEPPCPTGTQFNPATNKCESTPICPTGTQFNPATHKCEAAPVCPDGSAFNAETHKCEAAPVCPPSNNPVTVVNGLCQTKPGQGGPPT